MTRYLIYAAITCCLVVQIASAIPPLPSEYYGTIQLDGSPAPEGTLLVAKLGDKECGNITVRKPGLYGGEATFDQRLIVSCGDVPVSGTVTFWVNENCADKAAVITTGSSQKIDLIIKTGNKEPSVVVTSSENENSFQTTVTTKKSGLLPIMPILASILLIFFGSRKKR